MADARNDGERNPTSVCGGVNVIPFGNETATLFYKTPNGYAKTIITGCSWKSKDVRSVVDNAVYNSTETICRIPYKQTAPAPGDILVRGTISGNVSSEIELVRLLQKLQADGKQAFRVRAVKDNTGALLPHWAASGA